MQSLSANEGKQNLLIRNKEILSLCFSFAYFFAMTFFAASAISSGLI